jgi:heme oxygenase (biliverdin-producing, ferredoxin)
MHTALLSSPPPPLTAYTSRLQALSDSPDPSLLLAHAYVRYLGDMRGGVIIRNRLAEAYGLDEVRGLGVKFYDWKELGKPQVQQWYRDGLDLGVGDNLELKGMNTNIMCDLVN